VERGGSIVPRERQRAVIRSAQRRGASKQKPKKKENKKRREKTKEEEIYIRRGMKELWSSIAANRGLVPPGYGKAEQKENNNGKRKGESGFSRGERKTVSLL